MSDKSCYGGIFDIENKLLQIESKNIQSYIKDHGIIDISNVRKEDRKKLLRTGCVIGDVQLVYDCIDIGEKVIDPILIEHSSYHGYYKIVKMLLENGASPFGNGSSIPVSKSRCHYKVHNLLNQYARKYKINKLLGNDINT